jgi:hypothetical protein
MGIDDWGEEWRSWKPNISSSSFRRIAKLIDDLRATVPAFERRIAAK